MSRPFGDTLPMLFVTVLLLSTLSNSGAKDLVSRQRVRAQETTDALCVFNVIVAGITGNATVCGLFNGTATYTDPVVGFKLGSNLSCSGNCGEKSFNITCHGSTLNISTPTPSVSMFGQNLICDTSEAGMSAVATGPCLNECGLRCYEFVQAAGNESSSCACLESCTSNGTVVAPGRALRASENGVDERVPLITCNCGSPPYNHTVSSEACCVDCLTLAASVGEFGITLDLCTCGGTVGFIACPASVRPNRQASEKGLLGLLGLLGLIPLFLFGTLLVLQIRARQKKAYDRPFCPPVACMPTEIPPTHMLPMTGRYQAGLVPTQTGF